MTDSPDVTPELVAPNDFPTEVSARICRHMNQDHSDAVLLYAQGLAGLRTATAATLEAIDCEGMDLVVWEEAQQTAIRIEFQTPLSGPEAAHHHLVDLVQAARQQLTTP
ncbi:Putative heme iron utilization protein [Gloeomargarita lithophora Alchichica-D10]|uniref:Heme iron utilization protein n=1 Tax=Gloeomargarita lithophora Alchichica-D10 TaxID=1188229 RepID=A0A1J0ACZ6_9CYAN|nr:DUF2470 domain-containing protein [Gloeomargarita lithophora]APB33793.1 Putative heme iron utilization protein [Gloeomargarita lithophora Alchichica-D10]